MHFLAESERGVKRISLFLFSFFLFGTVTAQVVDGKLNVEKVEFPATISLDGEWEFYQDRLYQPYNIPNDKSFAPFPRLWNQLPEGHDTSPFGVATYHMTINFPEKPADFALFVDDMYSAYHLYVDEKIVAINGNVSKDPEEYTPEWVPQIVPLKQVSGEVSITLHIANFSHSKGGISESIILGDYDTILTDFTTKKVYDIILTCFFVFLGLFFFVRFTFTLSGFESFYFSMFCFAFSYQIIGAKFYVLHQVVENYPWEMGVRFEYIALFLSAMFFGLYIKSLYPEETGKYPFWIFFGVSMIYLTFPLFTPIAFFTGFMLPYFIFLFIYFFYAFTIFISAMGKKRKGAVMGVIGSGVLFMAMSYTILNHLGLVPKWNALTFFGYGFFMFFHSLQLFQHENHMETDQDQV